MSAQEEAKPETTTEAPAASETKETNTQQPATYTEMASNAASSAGTAAAGVKDSVFSMFGGGAKKEKKEDGEGQGEVEDRSGSSKAVKEKEKEAEAASHKDGEAEDGGEGVSLAFSFFLYALGVLLRASILRWYGGLTFGWVILGWCT